MQYVVNWFVKKSYVKQANFGVFTLVILSQKGLGACGILLSQRKNKEDNNMSAVNIGKHNFAEEVIHEERPVLLDFWAPWCAPCRMVVPIVEQIAKERPDIKVAKVNVDEQPELASRFRVISIPTLMVMKNGQIVNQALGARPKDQILAML
jgi:thioredoxin 1